MTPLRELILVSLVLLVGCTLFESKQDAYLRSAQDRATQDEIRQQLGPPRLTKPLEAGGSVWVYQFWYHDYGDRLRASGSWCDEYVLTFDSQAVLRRWNYATYRHQGELMPRSGCAPGASAPAS
ncbi:MAG: hypothetical protein HY581_01135 [Nitrospirae bacterium]|nr:hypothetical protein [Nitrospirota bacterium]